MSEGRHVRWPRLVAGAALVAAPLFLAVPRWDALLANHPAYPVTLASTLILGTLLLLTATRATPAKPGVVRTTFRVLGATAAIGLALTLLWLAPASAEEPAIDALASDARVEVTDTRTSTTYTPASPTLPPFVLYPGALIDPRAYAVLARGIAEAGAPATVLKCPYDIAFLCQDPTDKLPVETPWAVGGHSLGGVMASSYVGANAADGVGLVFWASYPLDDLSGQDGLQVASISGTQDGLSTPADIDERRDLLPASTTYVPIDGAVHAFFGDYGEQAGDGTPTVDREVAQAQIVEATVDLLAGLQQQ